MVCFSPARSAGTSSALIGLPREESRCLPEDLRLLLQHSHSGAQLPQLLTFAAVNPSMRRPHPPHLGGPSCAASALRRRDPRRPRGSACRQHGLTGPLQHGTPADRADKCVARELLSRGTGRPQRRGGLPLVWWSRVVGFSCHGRRVLERYRGQHAEAAVAALSVVEDLQVLKDRIR